MEKVFKSKVDISFTILTTLPLLICLIIGFNQNELSSAITSIAVCLIALAFFVHLYFSTFYTIINNKLLVKSSFLLNYSIDIQSIKKIEKSDSWEKAPALSLDRLEIKYNEEPAVRYDFYDSVIISPENKEEFIEDLLKINPQIEVV
ncbi:MAG: PH domain-containing protein [Bacteroidota bacterium]